MNKEYLTIPTICPFCGQQLSVQKENESAFLVCTNDLCESKVSNSINHYCSKNGIDIKGISSATIDFLIDQGWINNILDLYNLENYSTTWSAKSGWGVSSVSKIINNIKSCSNGVEPWRLLSSMGIPLVGKRMSKQLLSNFSSLEEFIHNAETGYTFEKLSGVGPEIATSIRKFNYSLLKELLDKKYVTLLEIQKNTTGEEKNNTGDTCKGLTFVITGSLTEFKNRNELVEKIESLGGKVAGSVSGNTNYLIINDPASTSSKAVKARSLGVTCITEKDFIDKFL